MRRCIFASAVVLLFLICSGASAIDYPTLQYYVTDQTNTLLPGEILDIQDLCVMVYNQTGAEMAVLVVNTTQPDGINVFATKTFQKNGLGQEGKDNGMLLVVSTDEKQWMVEVGYGLEGALPDARVGDICTTHLVPYLDQSDYYDGIYETIDYLGGEIFANYSGAPAEEKSPYPISWIPLTFWQLVLIAVVIIILGGITRGRIFFFIPILLGRGGGGKKWGGGRTGGGGAGGKW